MTEQDISIQEIANTFRAGQKQYRLFEKGAALADAVMGLEQNKSDLERAVAELNDRATKAANEIQAARAEAEKIIETAKADRQAEIDATDVQIKNSLAEANKELEQLAEKSSDLVAKIEDREDELKTLDAAIEEKQAQLKSANKELEDIRARLRGI